MIAPSVAAAADYAYEKYGMETVILPIELPRDSSAGESVASLMHHKPYIIRHRYDSALTIGVISKMSAVMGMRLHSLVFAANANVPVAGIIYDIKVEGFMNYIGKTLCCDISDANTERLCGFVDEMAQSDRDELKVSMERLREVEHVNVDTARRMLLR